MDFFSLLSIYYACDQAAQETILSRNEAARCVHIYTTVKLQFLTSSDLEALETADIARRAALLQVAYLRFKDWEAQNDPQVRALRQGAPSYLPRG